MVRAYASGSCEASHAIFGAVYRERSRLPMSPSTGRSPPSFRVRSAHARAVVGSFQTLAARTVRSLRSRHTSPCCCRATPMPPMATRSPRTASRTAPRRASIHHAGSCSRVPSSRSMSSCGARPTAKTAAVAGSRSTTLVDWVPQSTPRKARRILALTPGVVTLRDAPCIPAACRADDAAAEIVRLHVDPAVEARLAGLVGGVVVGRPLKDDVGARARFDPERTLFDGPLGETAREVLAPGETREDLRGGAAEGAVSRDVTLE